MKANDVPGAGSFTYEARDTIHSPRSTDRPRYWSLRKSLQRPSPASRCDTPPLSALSMICLPPCREATLPAPGSPSSRPSAPLTQNEPLNWQVRESSFRRRRSDLIRYSPSVSSDYVLRLFFRANSANSSLPQAPIAVTSNPLWSCLFSPSVPKLRPSPRIPDSMPRPDGQPAVATPPGAGKRRAIQIRYGVTERQTEREKETERQT